MRTARNETKAQILYTFATLGPMCTPDLAEVLGISEHWAYEACRRYWKQGLLYKEGGEFKLSPRGYERLAYLWGVSEDALDIVLS